MVSPPTVDYQNSTFEIINLSHINWEPTFKSIRILQLEIINAQCVHSDLGRGSHGYVGLGFCPREYVLYSNTVYRKLDQSPYHTNWNNTPHVQYSSGSAQGTPLSVPRSARSRASSFQQIATTTEPQYLKAFRDTGTGWINLLVYNLIWQLYQLHGK